VKAAYGKASASGVAWQGSPSGRNLVLGALVEI